MPDTFNAPRSLTGSRYALRVDQGDTHAALEVPEPEQEEITGYVHSYETAGTLDGPGIRFVGFLTGCHFRCQYCHNPDTWHVKDGRHVTLDEAMATIEDYADFLISYGGGVTFSGGEVMVQDKFITNLVRRCKQRGLHVCLDTNGYLGHKVTPQLMQDVDLWLLDIKSFDPEIHKNVTGVDVQPVLDFARRLSDEGRTMWVRFVLVPGLTDDVDNVEGLAEFVSTLNGVERVEILPFHKMGEYKWEQMGLEYKLKKTLPPTPELIARVRKQFTSRGLNVPQ
ncbi:MAG: pyruvate formate-lyase-activating protein [Alphaproteobacteria bacterium]|nr:pyruvate formate-lyase-activating protein [Alphaproteobacteria bacterium]